MSEAQARISSELGPALIRRVARGDEAAVEELYRSYGDAVLRFLFRRCGERIEDAEEVTLDTFVTASKLASTFREDCSAFAWLCSIAKLRLVDRLRKQGRDKRIPRDRIVSMEDVGAEQTAGVTPSDAVADQVDATRFVDDLMSRLSNDEREALMLRHVEELSVREVAVVMKRTEKGVEGLLGRARQKLRNTLPSMARELGGAHAL